MIAQRYLAQPHFQFSHEGHLVTDTAGRILAANEVAAAWLEDGACCLAGTLLSDYLAPGAALTGEALGALFKTPGAQAESATRAGDRVLRLTPARLPDSVGAPPLVHWLVQTVAVDDARKDAPAHAAGTPAHAAGTPAHAAGTPATLYAGGDERQMLASLMGAAPVGIAVVRPPDYRYEFVNRAYAAMPGLAGKTLTGRTMAEVLPDAVARDAIAPLNQAWATGQTVTGEAYELVVDAEASSTYWDVTCVPLPDAAGEIDRLMIVTHDVTEEVLGRRRLQELLARDEAILTHLSDGLVISDPAGNVIYMNPAALRLHGYASLAEVGRHREEFPHAVELRDLAGRPLPPEAWPLSRLLREGTLSDYRVRIKLRCTGAAWVGSYSGTVVYDDAGAATLAVLTLHDITGEVTAAAERERLLSELATERARLRAILDAMPIGVVIADAAGHLLEANDAVAAIWGGEIPMVERPEAYDTYRAWWSDTGEPLTSETWALARALTHGEQSVGEEIDILRFDGTCGTILNAAAPVYGADGEIIGGIAINQDITEIKRAQAALKRYADRIEVLRAIDQAILAAPSAAEIAVAILPHLETLFGTVHLSVSLLDPEAMEVRVLAATGRGETQLVPGYTGQLTLDEPLEQLQQGRLVVVEDLAAAPPTPLHAALVQAGVRAYTAVPLRVKQRLIGVLTLGREHLGRLDDALVPVAQDVANELAIGLQQAELQAQVQAYAGNLEQRVAARTAELQASEARFRTIFNQAAVGMATVAPSGALTRVNAAMERMLGYAALELQGKTFPDLAHSDDREAEQALFAEMLAGERASYQIDKRYIHRDGHVVWGRLIMSLVRDAAGAPQFAIGMVQDITAQKDAQAALIRAEKLTLTGRMAAAFTHEISNPLQSVMGALALLQEDLAADDDAHEFLTLATSELERVGRIVGELRNLNRRSGPEEREPVDMVELVEHVLQLSTPQAAKRHVDVVWTPPAQELAAPMVRDRVHQVLLNLVLNAIDAMPDGGRLEVRLAPTDDPCGATVEVCDTGVGMPAEVRARLFEPFFTTKESGLGLGLYVCQQIVTDHGGRIEVESAPGAGTTFTVWLPAA